MSENVKNTTDMPNNNRLQLVWAGLTRNNRWSSYICQKDVNTFNRRMEGEGPEFYARLLGGFRTALLTGLGEGAVGPIPGFGKHKDSVLPRFLYGAMRRIFTDTGVLRDVIDVDAVACVNQLTAVFTKIEGGHTPQSEVAVIESFVKTEKEIAATSIDYTCKMQSWSGVSSFPRRKEETLAVIVDRASRLVRRVLSGSDPREISPKHGSGVSACGTDVRDRYAVPRYVESIDKIWPMSEYYFASPTAFCDKLQEYLDAESYDPCAKVLLVPKDARGPRLISCEPRETMWIQQGLMAKLYSTIEGHSLTRRRVNFTRQEYNQLAAYEGSLGDTRDYASSNTPIYESDICRLEALQNERSVKMAATGRLDFTMTDYSEEELELIKKRGIAMFQTAYQMRQSGLHRMVSPNMARKLATLDLKDASDRLRLDVVQRIFPPNWAEALTACRSGRTVLPSGELVTLHKHAPMGSAVCFPVMALVIWAVLTAIAPRCSHKDILVYGDDIVVPCYMAEDAIQVLEAIGLRVNVSKSFLKGPFRESCGEEYVFGCRVTPVRLRHTLDNDVESLMAAMAFSNNMLESPTLSDNGWFLELLQDWYGHSNVPIIMQPSTKKVTWLDHVQRLEVGDHFRNVTLSGVALTDDPNRVSLPTGRNTRLHGRYAKPGKPAYGVRQYRLVVPVPRVVRYDTSDWCHVLRSLTQKSARSLGLDTVHNRVRFVRRWVTIE